MKEGIKEFSVYLPGAIFVMLGILVVFFPMFLVGLFSAALILIGITAISVAHQLRKYQRNVRRTVHSEYVNPFVKEWPHRMFVHRRW